MMCNFIVYVTSLAILTLLADSLRRCVPVHAVVIVKRSAECWRRSP
jgi:hypothetical protein